MVRDRAILTEILTCRVYVTFRQNFQIPGYTQNHLPLFVKNHFPVIFDSHIEFLCNNYKNAFISEIMQDKSDFDEIFNPQVKFSTHIVCTESSAMFAKNVFPPFLVAIKDFFVKCENALILENVQDTAILTKLSSCRVYTESSATFRQILLSCHFWPWEISV